MKSSLNFTNGCLVTILVPQYDRVLVPLEQLWDAGAVEDLKKELGECKMKLVKEKENVFVVKSLKHDVKECKKLLQKERMKRLEQEQLSAGVVFKSLI